MISLSLFDISLKTANKFYSWGWKASLVGATITFIGVGLLMWGTLQAAGMKVEAHIGELLQFGGFKLAIHVS